MHKSLWKNLLDMQSTQDEAHGVELTILFFSCVLKDGALSRWAGAGAMEWDQPVGLWLGELPASKDKKEEKDSGWKI